jgi:methyl halide transferase
LKFKIHDAEYLGKLLPNSQITALDISKSAVESCKASIGAQTTNVEFVLGDFFDEEDHGFSSGFDLIYDHTFLCALNPQLRPDWARRIKQLARKYLLTVEFPLAEESEEVDLSDGPPFQLSHSIYHELLDDKFQLIHKWDRTFVPTSNEKRRGREQLSLWIKN